MPTNGSHVYDHSCSYEELLDEVHEVITTYSPAGSILWAGDLNAYFE